MKFLRWLLIAFVAANIPWIGWGVIFGWPAIILTALGMTDDFLKPHPSASWWDRFGMSFAVCFVANLLNCAVWSIYTHEWNFGIMWVALPSIFVFAVLAVVIK